jgi:hypothetical protein
MVDISDVRDVWAKLANHAADSAACFRGIDGYRGKSHFGRPPCASFEIYAWNEMMIVRGGFPSGIEHGKQGDFVALTSQERHNLEKVDFRAAKGVVILVAE